MSFDSPEVYPKLREHDESERPKRKRKERIPLPMFLNCEKYEYEIGIDEAGRGPMFGRLYVAGVVLPKDSTMNTTNIYDSKKISKKQLPCVYDYIIQNALAYHITHISASTIDTINIREAVMQGMQTCAREIIRQLENKTSNEKTHDNEDGNAKEKYFLMIDGNDFVPYHHTFADNSSKRISYETYCQGDNRYANIAAASILAKVSRDNYIIDLCKKHPVLISRYSMDTHMGYGTKKHLDAIKTHGITQFHRKTYGICKEANLNYLC